MGNNDSNDQTNTDAKRQSLLELSNFNDMKQVMEMKKVKQPPELDDIFSLKDEKNGPQDSPLSKGNKKDKK